MTDLEKMVEKRALIYSRTFNRPDTDSPYEVERNSFTAGATDPLIVRAIELMERIKWLRGTLLLLYPHKDYNAYKITKERAEHAEAELAQLMAGIEGEK